MKKTFNILMISALLLAAFACKKDEAAEPEPVLSPVENLAAAASDGEVVLTWTAPTDAEPIDYQVTYLKDSSKCIAYTGGELSVKVENLSNGTEYVFSVASVYENSLLSKAAVVAATPSGSRQSVKGFSAAADDGIVHLSWEAAQGALAYSLSYSAKDRQTVKVTLPSDTLSYDAVGLENELEYNFSISVYYKKGMSEPTTAKATPKLARFPVKDFTATPGDGCVNLSWTSPSVNVLSYKLTIAAAGQDDKVVELGKDAVSYKAEGLTNGTDYEFAIVAYYRQGASEASAVKSAPVFTRIPVTGLKAKAKSATEVALEWTAPAAVEGFPVQKYTVTVSDVVDPVAVEATATSVVVGSLTTDKEYEFGVIAVYAAGNSEPVKVKCTPVDIIPWSVSKSELCGGESVTFTYDNAALPATDIKWTVNGVEKAGAVVTCPVEADSCNVADNTPQNVIVKLTANVSGTPKSWDVPLSVKPFVFIKKDWERGTNSYNGFKADVPVFSPDGKTIYVLPFNKPAILYALDAATGAEKWRFAPSTESGGYNGKTVNPVTGVIYFGYSTAGHFYAVNPDGTLKWENTALGAFNQTSFPAVSKDGKTIFVHDKSKKVTALKAETGEQIWQITAPAVGSGLLVNGTELVVASNCTTGGVKFLSAADGSETASLDLPAKGSDCAGIAVSPDRKTAYVTTAGGNICAINLDNHTLVNTVTVPKCTNIWELTVSASGDVFGGSKTGYAFCYSADLNTLKWQDAYAVANAYNYAHPCCDASGRFMITSGGSQNRIYLFNPDGTSVYWTSLVTAAQKQMAGNAYHNGILYSLMLGGAGDDGAMVAKYVGGSDALSGWPCHGGDLCGSCCIK